MNVLGLRSPFFKARVAEAEKILRAAAGTDKRFFPRVDVEPIIKFDVKDEKGHVLHQRYMEASFKGRRGRDRWDTEYGETIERVHVKLINDHQDPVLQVVVKPLYFGKPDVNYCGDDYAQLAAEVALAIKRQGNYIFNPMVRKELQPFTWVYDVKQQTASLESLE